MTLNDIIGNPPNGPHGSYRCEVCKARITSDEATESAFKLRRLYPINDPGGNVFECFMHNFCSGCVTKFKKSSDFDDYLEWYNNLPVYSVKG